MQLGLATPPSRAGAASSPHGQRLVPDKLSAAVDLVPFLRQPARHRASPLLQAFVWPWPSPPCPIMPTLRRHPGHRATPTPREGEGKDDSLESKPSEISIASLPRQEGLTEEQVLAARAVFAAADVDGSGTLERGELLSMFAELGLVLSTELMEEYVSSAAAVADSDAEYVPET